MRGGVTMQAVSQIVEGHVLGQVISLPKALQNTKLKITIVPVSSVVKDEPPKLTRAMLQESLKGSKIEALTGIAKTDDIIDLKEMQAERRMLKYGHSV